MKITIYTITDCQFSKQEKEYLSAHGLQFEEKNLETNREYLTEMLAVGSNFAGTPLTKIDKDDGQTVVLKGFTAAEFDKALGLEQPVAAAPAPEPVQAMPPVEVAPVVQAPVEPPVMQPVEPPAPQVPVAPPVAPPADPAIASILNNLEQQAQQPAAAAPGMPVIPDPKF